MLALRLRSSIRDGVGRRPSEHRCGRDLDGRLQIAQVAGRRKVLVLLGDADELHAVAWGERADDLLDDLVGCRRSGRDADDERRVEEFGGDLGGRVDPGDSLAAGLPGQLLEGAGVRRVRRTDDHDRPASRRELHQRRLPVGGGEAQVAATGRPGIGVALFDGDRHVVPVAMRERRLGE